MTGFRIAEAFVEVTARDNTAAGERRIRDRLNRIQGTANVRINVDTLSMNRASASVRAASRQIERSILRTGSAAPALSRITGTAFGLVGGLSAVTVAAGAAGSALAVLPALSSALGGIGATVIGAFSGVGDALKGYSADQKAAATAGNQGAAAAASNARQIRDAQQSIDDARRNQARVAREAADAVEDAEEDQKRAVRDGAEAVSAAARRVVDALDDEREAQEDLTEARADAARELDELREKVSDFALDQEGAAIRVAEAEAELAEVMADSTASALDRRKAEYELATARERASDLTREQAQSTAELAEAERLGVEGSDRVVSAQDRVRDAHRGVEDANRDLITTQRDAAESNAAAAERVAEAVVASGEAQEDANLAVASAIQSLRDVQASQAAEMAAATPVVSAYAAAMDKLTPAGRSFVEQLLSMKPLVMELRDTAQGAFLPGLTQMLKDSEGLFPIFKSNLHDTGGLMGDISLRWGQMFKDQTFQRNLDQMFQNGLPVIAALGEGMRIIVEKWVALGANSALAEGLSRGLLALFTGIGALLDSLHPFADEFGTLFVNIMTILGSFLPIMGTTLGVLATLVNLLGPALGPIIAGLAGLFIAAKVAAGLGLLTTAFKVLTLAFAISPFGVIMIALAGLVAGLMYAWQTSETFRNVVKGALEVVGNTATWLWRNMIEPAMRGIGAALLFVWNTLIKPYIDAWVGYFRFLGDAGMWLWHNMLAPAFNGIGSAASFLWNNVLRPVFDAMRGGVDAVGRGFQATSDWIGRAWDALREAVARPVRFIVNEVWNRVNDLWGGQDVHLGFATGGKVPGEGNRDTVPAMLTPGEFVVRKGIAEPTRRFLEALNSGQAEAVQAAGGMFGRVQQFAAGGAVLRAKDWARSQHGKPYIWGGVGPSGYDCSGFMSAITNVLRGQNPHQRLGVARSQPWPGFQRGLASSFATGFSQGHTAGTLDGDNVEAGGSPSRTKYRIGAVGADHGQFPGHAFLPEAGGVFASGGKDAGGGFFAGLAESTIRAGLAPLNGLISGLPTGPPMIKGIPRDIAIKLRDFVTQKALSFVGFGGSGGGVASGPVQEQVRAVARRFGWDQGSQWDALSALIQKESSWNPNAANPTSSARGLFQKMTSIHGPVEPTAGGQAEWGLNYIRGRYGTPSAAWAFHRGHNYYDGGGMLPPGMSMVHNATGKPERVLSATQTEAFERLVDAITNQRGADGVTVNVTQTSGSPAETGRFVALALRTVG